MLSSIGVDVLAGWVEFADTVEFVDKVEFGEVKLKESKVGNAEVAVAVELFEGTLAVSSQQ